MRKLAILLAAGLSATSALGATVTFAPNPFGSDAVDVTTLPGEVKFDLLVSGINPVNGALGGLSSIDVIVGGAGPLTMNAFDYSANFVAGALLPPLTPAPIGVYTNDLYFGGAQKPDGRPGGPIYNLGTLTVGVPVGTALGDYNFGVDSDFDGFSNLNGIEGLTGLGTVHVVPEPATLGLLALGALGLIRRRIA
jgi:hypothetical protein